MTHLGSMLVALAFYGAGAVLAVWLWPGPFPIDISSLWWKDPPFAQVVASSWPVLVWGGGVTLLAAAVTQKGIEHRIFARDIYKSNVVASVQAGVFEELIFRYLLYIIYIAALPAMNYVLFGWNGGGLLKWFNTEYLIPLANWATFDKLSDYLITVPWYIGAAVLAANASFRDGHKYLGVFGYVNSWFVGMYMFFLMFHYGLVVAIVVHAVYDILIFTINYFDTLWDTR